MIIYLIDSWLAKPGIQQLALASTAELHSMNSAAVNKLKKRKIERRNHKEKETNMRINLNNFKNEYMNLDDSDVNMPYDGIICLDSSWEELEEESEIESMFNYTIVINYCDDYELFDENGNEIEEFEKIGNAILKQENKEYIVDIIVVHNGLCLEDAIDLRYLIGD